MIDIDQLFGDYYDDLIHVDDAEGPVIMTDRSIGIYSSSG